MQRYHLENLDCAVCAARIEEALQSAQGVRFARVDFATTTLFLDADNVNQVKQAIQGIKPQVKLTSKQSHVSNGDVSGMRIELVTILLAGFLFIFGLVANPWLVTTPHGIGKILLFGLIYAISGWEVLFKAVRNIARGQVFDENFLMTVATVGAMIIGEFPEAAGVMLFYKAGEFLQGLSVNRSRRSIQALLEIRPDRARRMVEGVQQEVQPELVKIGETIVVFPGERIPLDGEVIIGHSMVDTAPLTGEPVPVSVSPGDGVLAGAINLEGLITLQVTRPFTESSIARILDLVEQAGSRKATTEKFITRFARIYSPIVVLVAIGIALFPPLLSGASFSEWFYRAMVVLVISCPCALVISIPLGYFGGVGGASRRGILVKGSSYLDVLAAVRTVIFDKTGTLTRGVFEVTQLQPQNGFSRETLLQAAAYAESGSTHPIARSIRSAYNQEADLPIETAREIAGHGVITTVAGQVLLAGNDQIMHQHQVAHDPAFCDAIGTVVHVAVDGNYAGRLLISDELKPEAAEAIQALRGVGVDRVLMLSGDNQATSLDIATQLGIDDFEAELLPEQKVTVLDQILSNQVRGHKVAFVGDGINDAPSLARADVGIAMGGLGSQAAIETSDVVIMGDSPLKVAEAIRFGQKTRSIVWQNILFALIIKLGFIVLGVAGEASMWQAVFGDMGVALLAIFNATRVLR